MIEMTGGYKKEPREVIKLFEDGAEGVDEMVVMKDIPVWSMCEHHMLPFFGIAHVAYIPKEKIIGLSKIPRLIDIFSRRFQVQERLTKEIADCLVTYLQPVGVGVVLNCRHLCMEARGVKTPCVSTQTSALRGAIKKKPEARAEFLSLIRGR